MVLDPEDKRQVKENFNDWLDLTEQRTELSSQIVEVKKGASLILDIETPKVTKLFSYLKKLYEDGTDEFGELKELAEEIKS